MKTGSNDRLSGLTESQKHELKKCLLLEREDSVSFEDFCNCDELVSDDEVAAKLDFEQSEDETSIDRD